MMILKFVRWIKSNLFAFFGVSGNHCVSNNLFFLQDVEFVEVVITYKPSDLTKSQENQGSIHKSTYYIINEIQYAQVCIASCLIMLISFQKHSHNYLSTLRMCDEFFVLYSWQFIFDSLMLFRRKCGNIFFWHNRSKEQRNERKKIHYKYCIYYSLLCFLVFVLFQKFFFYNSWNEIGFFAKAFNLLQMIWYLFQ